MSKHTKKPENLPELSLGEKTRREIYDWIHCLSIALIICVVIFAFFVRLIDVRGTSMNPTLNNGDKMLVSGLFYSPKAGDVVVFKKDEYDPERALVKRVIATEGQVINIDFDNGIVYVDGQALDEPYIHNLTTRSEGVNFPLTVAPGHIFVLGDNRAVSMDSRNPVIGQIDKREVLGSRMRHVSPKIRNIRANGKIFK